MRLLNLAGFYREDSKMRVSALKEDNSCREARAKLGKAHNKAPTLHTFGSVAQLTAGGNGSKADNKSRRKK